MIERRRTGLRCEQCGKSLRLLALEAVSAGGRMVPTCFLTPPHYFHEVKAILTSKGQITIPAPIRQKFGLKAGQVLEFDENAPFLKAVPAFDEEEMRSVVGCAKSKMRVSSDKWLESTRGPVDLPRNLHQLIPQLC